MSVAAKTTRTVTPRGSASSGFSNIDGAEDPSLFLSYLLEAAQDPQVQEMKRQSVELLAPVPGQDALEVGCGLGEETKLLQDLVAPGRAVGVDGSERVLALARELHPDLDLRQGDARSLDFPDASFDLYRAERLYQHLEEPRRALKEALRVLRPGGRLVVGDPDWETLRVNVPSEGLLRRRVVASVENPRLPLALGPWLHDEGARLAGLFPSHLSFHRPETIARIVASASDGFTPDELEQVMGEVEERAQAGDLLGSLTLWWVVGEKAF